MHAISIHFLDKVCIGLPVTIMLQKSKQTSIQGKEMGSDHNMRPDLGKPTFWAQAEKRQLKILTFFKIIFGTFG